MEREINMATATEKQSKTSKTISHTITRGGAILLREGLRNNGWYKSCSMEQIGSIGEMCRLLNGHKNIHPNPKETQEDYDARTEEYFSSKIDLELTEVQRSTARICAAFYIKNAIWPMDINSGVFTLIQELEVTDKDLDKVK